MSGKVRSIEKINEKIEAGSASLLTESELHKLLREGRAPESIDVDIVTAAFSSSIRGSSAMLVAPVTGRGVFTRARKIWLNGVPGYPGPAPNERLGIVDTLIFADQAAGEETGGIPGGARLLIDIIEKRVIQVECLSEEGDTYRSSFTLEGLEFARMTTFNTFLPARLNIGAVSRLVRVGSRILLNRSPGIVVGAGTMSRPGMHSLSVSADMFDMDPACIGRDGEITISIALAAPITDSGLKRELCASAAAAAGGPIPERISEEDEKTASYLKGLLAEGRFKITDSFFPVRHICDQGAAKTL